MTTPILPTVPTAARPVGKESGHWYFPDGRACYEVFRSDGAGTRATTLRDARKLGLLPSVTTILKLLHKEALEKWKIEQAVLAVVTTPRQLGETDDEFIHRVIHEEEQQEQEGQIARDRGTEIHDALELYLVGMQVDPDILPWIAPAAEAIKAFGPLMNTETNLVGPGFAGRTDLLQETETHWSITDYKSAKKLPDPAKGAWTEHRLQLAAYAKGLTGHEIYKAKAAKPIVPRNVYISTVNQGEFVICEHEEPWDEVYEHGFAPLVKHWQWATGYTPPNMESELFFIAEPAATQVLKNVELKPGPVVSTAVEVRPAPSNGPPAQRKSVVTHGQRVSPPGVPMPLPATSPKQ